MASMTSALSNCSVTSIFEPLSYDPLRRALSGSDGTAGESKNVLFVRDREFVEDRLVSASAVAVLGQSF